MTWGVRLNGPCILLHFKILWLSPSYVILLLFNFLPSLSISFLWNLHSSPPLSLSLTQKQRNKDGGERFCRYMEFSFFFLSSLLLSFFFYLFLPSFLSFLNPMVPILDFLRKCFRDFRDHHVWFTSSLKQTFWMSTSASILLVIIITMILSGIWVIFIHIRL